MFHRQKNPGEDRDSRVKKESRSESVSEKQIRAKGRNYRLNIQDDVHDRRVSVLERESEENRPDGGAGKAGEDQVTPGPAVDLAKFAEAGQQERQKHQQNQNVLPKDNHLGVEQLIERDAPRA